ncbi:MAG: CvpA family protein [Saprospiraceae bacterium]|nr:CvpA family protein [Saprospiraceae bacterium]
MPIDLIFLIVFGYGFWQGYNRGIVSTVFNILAYVFGVVFAFKITPLTTNILERMFNSQNPTLFAAAFILNMALIMFMMRATAKAFERGLQAVYLGFLNRTLGGALMASLAVLIYSILLWFAVKVQFVNQATLDESRTYYKILEKLPGGAKQVASQLRPFAEEAWDTSLNWLDRLDKYGIQKTESAPNVYKPKGGAVETAPEGTDKRPTYTYPTDDDGIEE